eukprot:TRINITY_DN68139_c0_g1_i1.p1 TRINITY_DN68139_c0_g1~~TRINITY_DN68139_c0_g1_i1.p1  ORF type:complete len:277 (-),score=32.86 TRINITY_DN68139_c0_g1_i1:504-1334(-)
MAPRLPQAQASAWRCLPGISIISPEDEPVILHVYDLNDHVRGVNSLMKRLGTGLYHGAVEVYGCEWSYGCWGTTTGVFSCQPTENDAHSYQRSVHIGNTKLSRRQVMKLLDQLKTEWQADDYSLLQRNCTDFCNEFCKRLGVGKVPGWIKSAAGLGARLDDTIRLRQLRNVVAAGKSARGASPSDNCWLTDPARGMAMIVKMQVRGVLDAGRKARGAVNGRKKNGFKDLPLGLVYCIFASVGDIMTEGKAARHASKDDKFSFGDILRGIVATCAKR